MYSCNAFYVFIDPSAKGLSEEIKRASAGRMYGILKDAENTVVLGIARVQKCLTYGILSVSPEQGNLVDEFGLYEYDKDALDRGKEQPVKMNDHCMDALRYLVMGLWNKLEIFSSGGRKRGVGREHHQILE